MTETARETVRLSPSIAKILLDKSPRHAYAAHRLLGNEPKPEPSSSVLLGKAVDAWVFGTGMVKAYDARKDKGKTFHGTDILITPAAYRTAQNVSLAVQAAMISRYGTNPYGGTAQLRMEWNSNGDVPCSAVIDWYRAGVVMELKTAHDLSDAAIVKAIELYRYDLQIAAYCEAVTELYGIKNPEPVFCFAETAPPYDVRFITPDPRMLGNGTADWMRAVKLWKECMDSGKWPGRGDAILGPSQYRENRDLAGKAAAWMP